MKMVLFQFLIFVPSARLETPRSTTPLATHIGYEHRSISSPHPDIFDVNVSRYPETPGKINLHKAIPISLIGFFIQQVTGRHFNTILAIIRQVNQKVTSLRTNPEL
jgi:hypothetical protein